MRRGLNQHDIFNELVQTEGFCRTLTDYIISLDLFARDRSFSTFFMVRVKAQTLW